MSTTIYKLLEKHSKDDQPWLEFELLPKFDMILSEEFLNEILQKKILPTSTSFKKGHIPWNKGIKDPSCSKHRKEYWKQWRKDNPDYKSKWKINNRETLTYEDYCASRSDNTSSLNRTVIKCPHCNKEGNVGNMKRWHFDNCKHKD